MKTKGALIIIGAIAVVVLFLSAFVVDETEQVVITQFGKVIGEPITSPGLKFKIPFIQIATFFPKNLQSWDGEPGQIPTLEKTYIWVDAFARWKIVDPVQFFETVNNLNRAKGRLDDIIDPAVRNAVTSYRLIETVRKSNRELDTMEVGVDTVQNEEASTDTKGFSSQTEKISTYIINTGREKIMQMILEQAQPKLKGFGIELVDVKIKRINYVDQVRKSVYGRMIAERNQIAEKFRSEGQGEAKKILGEKERDLKEITSEAYRRAQQIKGKADAEATRIFADAFGVDADFYSFSKTLETYKTTMDSNSSLVISTDSDFFKYLKGYSQQP
ncbi:MAG: protease modulator HflC [Desulfobacterales bacterium]|jgi:membrane protease subunit HflC|nr:protease modulator HflC [Desulfobacterales bacterium]